MGGDRRRIGTVLLLAAAYLVAAKAGLRLASVHPSATPVWPPTGIALASILLLGYRVWPGVFLGAFLANATTFGTVWTSLGIATGNTLEGVVGAYLVNAYAGGRNAFNRPQDIFRFAAWGALVSTMISATIGVSTLALGGVAGWADFWPIWVTWWLGDAGGALIVAPMIVLWALHPAPGWDRRGILERALFLSAFIPVGWVVFGGAFPFAFLTVPFLIWAAFRFGQRDAATAIALLAALAVWGTLRQLGPFRGPPLNESFLLLQTFLSVQVLVALPLAGVVWQRRAADHALRRRQAEDELIGAIAAKTAGETDLGRMLTAALEMLRERISFTGGSIALVEGDDLVIRCAAGLFAEAALGQRMPRGQGRAWQVVATGEPFLCNDLAGAGLSPATPMRSYLAVPLMWKAQAFGVLEVDSVETGAFRPDDLGLMRRVAAALSGSIELARRFAAEVAAKAEAEAAHEESGRLFDQLAGLQEVTAALSQAVTAEQVLGVMLDQGVRAMGAAAAAYFEVVDGGRMLELVRSVGYPEDVIRSWHRHSLSAAMWSTDAARSQEPVFLESGDELRRRYPHLAEANSPFPESARVAVPLVFGGRSVGVLVLNFAQARRFGQGNRVLMLGIAGQCAQALDRARLYEAERMGRQEAERVADRILRLQRVTAALSQALTPVQVAEVVLAEGMRALGTDAGLVYSVPEGGTAFEILHSAGYTAEHLARLPQLRPSSSSPSVEAARTRTPLFFDSRDAVVSRYPALRDGAHPHTGARAFIPLLQGGRPIGTLLFVWAERRVFQESERAFMETLAYQCAQALDRAMLYHRQQKIAETLQRAFLPAALPELPGIQIRGAYIPGAVESDVGGDWHDAFALPDGRIALSVGDVIGHGLESAVMMGQLRQTIRAAALDGASPSEVLDRANRVLTLGRGMGAMATAVYGVLDPMTWTFTYANAGHPPPVVGRRGSDAARLGGGGLPLGTDVAFASATHSVRLAPGTLLLLYTDGLVEGTRNILEGEAALLEAVEAEVREPSPDPARSIVHRMLGDAAARDDVALVALAIAPAPFDRFAITVPAVPRSLRPVRQALQRLGAALGLAEDRLTALQLAVGEAVNNAIEHAYGAGAGVIDVRARRDGTMLRVEIEDHGRWRPERSEGRGYGLQLMGALVAEMAMERKGAGTLVMLSVPLPAGAASPAAAPEAAGAPPARAPAGAPAGVEEILGPGDPAAAPQTFEVGHVNGIPIVEVKGDIDLTNVSRLWEAMEKAAREDKRAIIASLQGASYLDSHAIRILLRFGARAATNRQELVVIVPRESMARRIFEISGLVSALRVCDTLEEGVAAVQPKGPRSRSPRD